MSPRTPAVSTKPSFIHHDKITKGLENIFGSTRESVKISDINVLEMLKLIPITPNSISLLSGIMGTGKTSYARAFTNVFFKDSSLGMIKCDPDKTPHEIFYGTDVASETVYAYDTAGRIERTHEQFIFDPEALAFVTKPIKFANEISRSNKAVQDALLGLFQEGEIEYRGKVFKTEKPFIALLDQNPLHLQSMGARELEPALIDRIDISINMPTTGIFDDLAIQTNKDSSHVLETLLDYDIMKEVFADVEKVRKPLGLKFLTVVISQSLRACKYKKDISSPIFIESIDCVTCEYKNEICSAIEAPIGHRHIESILKFAGSRAWLQKRDEINIEDIITVMPFALAHRLKLKTKAYMDADSTYTWIKEKALPLLVKQLSIYQQMLEEYSKSLEGSKSDFLTAANKCKTNLLYQQIMKRIGEQILSQGNKEIDAVEQVLLNLKNPTRKEIELVVEKPNLKISKMVASFSEKELNEIEAKTDMLSKYELGEKIIKDDKDRKKERKDITYQKNNPVLKNIETIRQRFDKIKEAIRQALEESKLELMMSENEFMGKLLPLLIKYLDNNEIIEFGSKHRDEVIQSIGGAEMNIKREDSQITFILKANTRVDLEEAKTLIGM
ncbi:MAG: putative magnesium chelatase [Candidatus Methanoperedens nitroreducens]|uniref:Putative magnesium chelatase n=1 Tax=Candidatus Methanoperedens nitratireducens TaxID=1392998 RepID=A0A0P7ZJ17_9EURY|nr:MAG: putative magnesium chelatase [Candidatus Methanoperedens sp. BLZ1]